MVDADTDPAGIRGKIIDAIGHRTTKFLDQEIVDPDRFRISLGAIFPAIVAEVADQFLLLGVDRDHRLLFCQSRTHLNVDVGELGVAVRMAVAFLGLAVALQAVARRVEQLGHQGAARLVPLLLQCLGQMPHALAGPPQRRLRIAAARWFDQRIEIAKQGRVPRFREGRLLTIAGLRPAPGRRTRSNGSSWANSFRPRPIVLGAMPVAFATAVMPPYPAANASAAATKRRPLVEKRRYRGKPLPDGVDIDHHNNIWYESQVANTYFYAIKSRCGNFLTDPNRSILTLVPIGLFSPLGWTRLRSRRRNFIRNSVTASSAGSIIRPTSSEFSFRSG